MSRKEYVAPKHNLAAFNCPNCGAYAHQDWFYNYEAVLSGGPSDHRYQNALDGPGSKFSGAKCKHCGKSSFWRNDSMIYPPSGAAPLPNSDLPPEALGDYEEASTVLNLSPRSSAALLRVCIERLCRHLGETGDLNAAIASLVKKGLPVEVQQALDSVRVIGNGAVHPGQMDPADTRETALALFELVNIIVDRLISEPARIKAIYASLPESKRDQIAKRDGSTD